MIKAQNNLHFLPFNKSHEKTEEQCVKTKTFKQSIFSESHPFYVKILSCVNFQACPASNLFNMLLLYFA